jgi:16S rRNA (guanine527-N7)-methyltransferase
VVAARHLDVPVLPDLFFYYMEKAPEELEVVLQYFADFSPVQLQQLAALQDLYTEWNAKINVISRKDIGSLYERHILHSLAIAAVFEFTPGMEIIDIGTGGGFPGIPLAIFFPEARFHLIDSIGKKIKVVEAVVEATALTNVTTQPGRAEEIKGRKFDVAVSRAVAPLATLWTWARPLLRKPTPPTVPPAGSTAASSALPSASTESSSAPAPPDAQPAPSGLICLKGGDLAAEISASGLRPRIMDIQNIFPLDSFHDKYLLQVPF